MIRNFLSYFYFEQLFIELMLKRVKDRASTDFTQVGEEVGEESRLDLRSESSWLERHCVERLETVRETDKTGKRGLQFLTLKEKLEKVEEHLRDLGVKY